MKKLFSILMALCLLCTAAAALADDAVPSFDDMPGVIIAENDVELTDADFEGEWAMDTVFYGTTYLSPEEVEANGLAIRPIRIADGKVYSKFEDEDGEHETSTDYTIESNQLLFSSGDGLDFVIEKLVDGNIAMNIFLPGEGDTLIDISIFMVHPEA